MAVKNTVKTYIANGYYHIYNRGVNKQSIFPEEIDKKVFLAYLRDYLTPVDRNFLLTELAKPTCSWLEKNRILKRLSLKNYYNEITLLCFGLMPNHFHLELKQKREDTIIHFMNAFTSRYSLYIKNKYHRTGPLFDNRYKGVLIETDEQLLELSRYIHKQAAKFNQPSSYKNFLGDRNTSWIRPEEILNFFSKTISRLSYADFCSQPSDNTAIATQLIEEDEF